MGVKIGNSYVSAAAASFAKNSADDEKNILKNLREKFPNLKISVGTSPFSGSGTNNLSISPKILQEMQNNLDKKIEYEALIYDIASQNFSQPGLKSHGFIITDDGGLRGWGISQHDDRKTSPLNKKNKNSWLESLLPKKNPAAKVEISKKNVNDFMKDLQKKFSSVKNGAATISKKYLQKCLNSEDEQKKFFENLKTADEIFENADKNQNVRVKIDAEGNMTVESSKTTVTFNESKRVRQLAAAQTVEDVQSLLNLLQEDLNECEDGVKNNFCDEDEVKKVKKMIERAEKKLNEVKKNPPKNNFSVDVLI